MMVDVLSGMTCFIPSLLIICLGVGLLSKRSTFCQEYHTAFVCLPHNSMHTTQPLNIAYFSSLKVIMDTVEERKELSQCLPRDLFPTLFKKSLAELH